MKENCTTFTAFDTLFTFYNHKILRKIIYVPFKIHIKNTICCSEFNMDLLSAPDKKKIYSVNQQILIATIEFVKCPSPHSWVVAA